MGGRRPLLYIVVVALLLAGNYLYDNFLPKADESSTEQPDGGGMSIEQPVVFGEDMPEVQGALEKQREYKYSKTAVTIYRKG